MSINDKGHVAHVWNHNPSPPSRTLFYSCNPADLTKSKKIVSDDDELDLNGDGVADATLDRLQLATNLGPGLTLAETDMVYVRAGLKYAGSSVVRATLGFPVNCCGDGAVQSGEDCDDIQVFFRKHRRLVATGPPGAGMLPKSRILCSARTGVLTG